MSSEFSKKNDCWVLRNIYLAVKVKNNQSLFSDFKEVLKSAPFSRGKNVFEDVFQWLLLFKFK